MPKPMSPQLSWLHSYVGKGLIETKGYHIDAHKVAIKVDQNESPWDWPDSLKDKVLAKLKKMAWNRYPSPYPIELESLIAKHVGVGNNNVLLAPGSNHMLSLILNAFTQEIKGKLVVARPSFPLYESHCRYHGIAYETWQLNKDFEYDRALLPALPDGSMVMFASPNNPTGNRLPFEDFRTLLKDFPKVLFIADEAYFEFSDEPFTPLLEEFSNMILVRTLSKTMGTAGIRLGYMVAAPEYIELVRKLMLPFYINAFTDAAISTVLQDPEASAMLESTIQNAKKEREFLYEGLKNRADTGGYWVKPTYANFLLVKWNNVDDCRHVYSKLIDKGILVRDVSAAPTLSGCLRITVGTREENIKLLAVFS